jgi:hypothetical protein
MFNQTLEPRTFFAQPNVFAPGTAQGDVTMTVEMALGNQAGTEQVGDLLGIGYVALITAIWRASRTRWVTNGLTIT